jgi:hypothetical protein
MMPMWCRLAMHSMHFNFLNAVPPCIAAHALQLGGLCPARPAAQSDSSLVLRHVASFLH